MTLARRIVQPALLLLLLGTLAGSEVKPLLEAAAGFPATAATTAATAARPNLVLVLTDDQDLTLGSLDFMPRTRNLIARRGMTFSHHFVPLSLCCPSRATILTGLHAHRHKVYTNFPPAGGFERFSELGHEEATLATALQAAGYRTALVGKYLNGYPLRDDRGYIPPGWDEWASPVKGTAYSSYNYTLNENRTLVRYGSSPADYITDVLAGKATAFVRRAAAGGQPFFLYFATYAPHKPANPAPRHAGLFPDLQAPRTPSFDEADVRDKPARIRALPRLGAGQVAGLDALYRKQMRSLQAVDEAVAALVRTLRETGQLDNTYIVVTSDNGFHLGQHRLEPGKYTAYEPDVRVPLLVRGPGVPAGVTVDALTASVDLAPTFAALAGARLPVEPDGRSLVPLLSGPPPGLPSGWRQVVLLEQFGYPPAPPRGGSELQEPPDSQGRKAAFPYPAFRGLRTAGFKFVEYDTGEREVYDLRTDPDELVNLRDRVSRSWMSSLSSLAKALGSCAGDSCRQLESQPVPPIPGS
jgi:arylsulfatase A-like enzyme